jgi:hypothetical protein
MTTAIVAKKRLKQALNDPEVLIYPIFYQDNDKSKELLKSLVTEVNTFLAISNCIPTKRLLTALLKSEDHLNECD